MINNQQNNVGYFIEKEFNNSFTYRKTDYKWALERGYTHEIDVSGMDIRFGIVKKTCAYILCDTINGIELQKWKLKKNYVY
tara:strand:- start:615 stop:857 length:243 start_codon:yes stop_codon:yes gene_type:complete